MKFLASICAFSLAMALASAFFWDEVTTPAPATNTTASTTTPTPTMPTNHSIDCDFENNICGWDNSYDKYFNWERIQGSPRFLDNLIAGDHSGDTKKTYMYLKGENGHLTTPFTEVFGEGGCLEFYYFLGNTEGRFEVQLNGETIWAQTGTQSSSWLHAYVPIKKTNTLFKLTFKAHKEVLDEGDMAFDDVKLTIDKICPKH